MNSKDITTIDNATVQIRRELSDVQCDEIRRIGDKAVVAWLLVESSPSEDPGCIRPIYWVDVRTRKIVHWGYERWEDR